MYFAVLEDRFIAHILCFEWLADHSGAALGHMETIHRRNHVGQPHFIAQTVV